ncbi:MAG: DUF2062 domain-containing protein [Proteobacteria bacterium]|nr:DUF2062 domain-containing protein [Pseudomonadota bacterium]
MAKKENIKYAVTLNPKKKVQRFVEQVKGLQGDPHYVATGIAIGIFISFTPTIPFHTVIALLLSFIFRGSKPAAIIGTWFSNPLTIPVLYIGGYEVGRLILGNASLDSHMILTLMHTLESTSSFTAKSRVLMEFLKEEQGVFYIMMAGGSILGVISGIIAYFATYKIVKRIRFQENRS